jgi:hypothetical protein
MAALHKCRCRIFGVQVSGKSQGERIRRSRIFENPISHPAVRALSPIELRMDLNVSVSKGAS